MVWQHSQKQKGVQESASFECDSTDIEISALFSECTSTHGININPSMYMENMTENNFIRKFFFK